MRNRVAFIDFVQGLLHLDPALRWTPQQARLHPFVLGEPLLQPFVPPQMYRGHKSSSSTSAPLSSSTSKPGSAVSSPNVGVDPKRPYGGLPPTPQRSTTRTYQDAAYVLSAFPVKISEMELTLVV